MMEGSFEVELEPFARHLLGLGKLLAALETRAAGPSIQVSAFFLGDALFRSELKLGPSIHFSSVFWDFGVGENEAFEGLGLFVFA